jgi:PAS domain S-box-containing protein
MPINVIARDAETPYRSTARALPAGDHDDLRAVLAHTPFLFARCSAGLRYVFVSESYARTLGLRPDEIVGRPIIEIIGLEGFQTIRPYVEKVLRGEVVEFENDIPFASVGTRTFHGIYAPEWDEGGRVRSWVASIIDITAGKMAKRIIDADLQAMTLLQELGTELTREGIRVEDCLQKILDAAISLARADKGTVQLFDFSAHAFRFAAQRGFQDAFLKYFEKVRENTPTASSAALRSGAQVIVEDVMTDRIFAGQPSEQVLLDEGVRSVIATPLKSSEGSVLGTIATHFRQPHRPAERDLRFLNLLARQSADYLQRKRSEALEKTLIKELQHRTKNLLAVVQGIAAGMPKIDPEGFQVRFRDRLAALATSQDLLVKSQWQGVEIGSLVRGQLGHLTELIGYRITLTGPAFRLSTAAAQAIGMAIYELTTNASKYGSLSNGAGQVSIDWNLTKIGSDEDGFALSWVESGGPPVEHSGSRGFGTFVIEEMPQFQLDADVEMEIQSSGLRWRLSCPVGSVLHSDEGM